jgi:hypothetical protein
MRVWDVPPGRLCRNHLLGEHAELHAIWSVLTQGKSGYANHPETQRWKGKLKALYTRHERIAAEIARRGYKHKSPLEAELAVGDESQDEYVDPPDEQMRMLAGKGCGCCL